MKQIKIFLDDLRDAPEGWTIIRTAAECIRFMDANKDSIIAVSLDHDLGTDMSGYDVAKHMAEYGIFPLEIRVHSMNPVGAQNIVQLLQRYAPEGTRIWHQPFSV